MDGRQGREEVYNMMHGRRLHIDPERDVYTIDV